MTRYLFLALLFCTTAFLSGQTDEPRKKLSIGANYTARNHEAISGMLDGFSIRISIDHSRATQYFFQQDVVWSSSNGRMLLLKGGARWFFKNQERKLRFFAESGLGYVRETRFVVEASGLELGFGLGGQLALSDRLFLESSLTGLTGRIFDGAGDVITIQNTRGYVDPQFSLGLRFYPGK